MNITTMQHSTDKKAHTPLKGCAGGTCHQSGVAILTVDGHGTICACNQAAEALFNYCNGTLTQQKISMLLPELDGLNLIENGQPNPNLHFKCRIGRQFHAVTQDGTHFTSGLNLNLLDSRGEGRLSVIVSPA